jgi:hypothetical protein
MLAPLCVLCGSEMRVAESGVSTAVLVAEPTANISHQCHNEGCAPRVHFHPHPSLGYFKLGIEGQPIRCGDLVVCPHGSAMAMQRVNAALEFACSHPIE